MAAPVLTKLPNEIRAGTTVEYVRTLSQYPATLFTMTLILSGPSKKTQVATAQGSDHKIVLDVAATTALLPGNYQYVERVLENATSKEYDATVGQVLVLLDLESAAAPAAQTWEEKTLAIVESVLSGRATSDMQAYSIAGRSVSKIPIAELRAWREDLKRAVAQQRNPGSGLGNVRVEFPNQMTP
jgi:hypothetical protein